MSETQVLAEKLRTEGEKFAKYFSVLSESQWKAEVYTEDSVWTIRNILAHLVTAERAFVILFERIRQGGPGVSDDFAINRFNASQQARTKDLTSGELLDQYKAVRSEMVAWVSGISDADLEKKGRHPFLGETSLREMVKMVYIHNQTHYRDLRRVIK